MKKTSQQAYDDICAHIAQQGGSYSAWYCGITSDLESRLFVGHNVPREGSRLVWRECINNDHARAVEKALLELGCDGGEGGGNVNSVYVYAYPKTPTTNP